MRWLMAEGCVLKNNNKRAELTLIRKRIATFAEIELLYEYEKTDY